MSSSQAPIRVLIVEPSPKARRVLGAILQDVIDMTVVGEASTGVEGIRLTHVYKPNIVVMSCDMPIMSGFEAAKVIMRERPTPIVLLGTEEQLQDVALRDDATTVGVLDVVLRPDVDLVDEEDVDHTRFIKTLRAMSHVGVVSLKRDQTATQSAQAAQEYPGISNKPEIVFIVSSTGGPQALEHIMRDLPPDFPLPIVIVQHISDEFVGGLTAWLDGVTPLMIKLAEPGERPLKGHIYVAPIGYHLRMTFNGRFALDPDEEQSLHVPSGDILLESAADAYGANAIGVILTGMGRDGASGLLKMRQQGAKTIVQDEQSSVVFGMPQAAIEQDAAQFISPLENIAELLVTLAEETVQ